MHQMHTVDTARLLLRRFTLDDAPFILELLNEPSWYQHIGDKGVRTIPDARKYLLDGPLAMYERVGFGLLLIELRGSRIPVGMCGLIKRESLPDVDIGFALLPVFWGNGYAFEAARPGTAYSRRGPWACSGASWRPLRRRMPTRSSCSRPRPALYGKSLRGFPATATG
jgi:RimJ/RimL family protein N-acetyltransferase